MLFSAPDRLSVCTEDRRADHAPNEYDLLIGPRILERERKTLTPDDHLIILPDEDKTMKSCKQQKLPIDVQAFENMRGEDYLYVDKTHHIDKMISEGTYYFLARPRRFGKLLLISTLKCLFEGKKELFTGLWIAEHGDWEWQEHPVVLLDFSNVNNESSIHNGMRRRPSANPGQTLCRQVPTKRQKYCVNGHQF